SFEALPFVRLPRLGLVVDGAGFYRQGETEYDIAGGPRYSVNIGKWRPFVHAMAGIRHRNSSGLTYRPLLIDLGGGVDYKLWFKNFSWRFQGDYMHSHYASANQNDYRASTGIVWRFCAATFFRLDRCPPLAPWALFHAAVRLCLGSPPSAVDHSSC